MKSYLAILSVSMLAAVSAAAQAAPQGGTTSGGTTSGGMTPGAAAPRLEMIIDYQRIIESSDPEAGKRAEEQQRRKQDKLRQSTKWTEMERIERQGGERADLSRKAPGGKFKLQPVLGHRRQAGNPAKYNQDLDKKAVGLDFTLDF